MKKNKNDAALKKLKTNKGLLKTILLSIVTLGIYGIVVMTAVSTEINIVASKYDKKKTMYFCLLTFLIAPITFGIASLVWYHRISNRIGNELSRREIGYAFSAKCFWLWGVLGSFIYVGPFVYLHKLLKAVNKINASYNEEIALIEFASQNVESVEDVVPNFEDENATSQELEETATEEEAVEETIVEEAIVEEAVVEEAVVEETIVEEKPFILKRRFYERGWFWIIYCTVIFAVIIGLVINSGFGSSSSSGSGSSTGSNYGYGYGSSYNMYVSMIKEATHSTYGIKYGRAFDSFFSSPSWRHFKSTNYQDVVEFTGIFYYSGSPATAKIQFVINLSEGTFSAEYFEINGVAQNRIMLSAMIQKIFESYY